MLSIANTHNKNLQLTSYLLPNLGHVIGLIWETIGQPRTWLSEELDQANVMAFCFTMLQSLFIGHYGYYATSLSVCIPGQAAILCPISPNSQALQHIETYRAYQAQHTMTHTWSISSILSNKQRAICRAC